MKAVVAALNQEKALVGAYSVIVKSDCEFDGALHSTRKYVTCEACLVLVMFTVKVVFNIRLIAESTHDE